MKKLFSLCLCLIIVCVAVFPAYAQEQQQIPEESEIVARYVPCPAGGKHQMHPMGQGHAYSGPSSADPGEMLYEGVCGKCSGCGLYLLVEYWPTGMIPYPR